MMARARIAFRRKAEGLVLHIVLAEDSTIDNAAYVAPGQDVASLLAPRLPGVRVTSLARDGGIVSQTADRLSWLPADATHLFLSVGGNDALEHVGVLQQPAGSVGEALAVLQPVRARFCEDYARMLAVAGGRGLRIAVASIYAPWFEDPGHRLAVEMALPMFNEAILAEAFRRGCSLIDLRLIFDGPADFTHQIEPSAEGGAKLASALARWAASDGDGMRVFA
jgi:hypothetical protein